MFFCREVWFILLKTTNNQLVNNILLNQIIDDKYKGLPMLRKLLLLPITVITIAGCSEHDLDYYKSHIDKAESKIKQCESESEKAFLARDHKKLETLSKDSECNAAKQAYAEHQQALRQAELERKQAQYTKELKEYTELLSPMPIEEFYSIRKECRYIYGSRSAKCQAFNDLKDAKLAKQDELKGKRWRKMFMRYFTFPLFSYI